MKTEVTLSIGESLIREAQALAKRRGISLEQLVEEALEHLVYAGEASYEAAEARALARLHTGYDLGWAPATSHDELYTRIPGADPQTP